MHRLKKFITGLIIFNFQFLIFNSAHARLIFTNEVFVNDAETFVIGEDDDSAATNLILQFGGTNGETITWDGASTDDFLFSDDLNVTGGITASGTVTANGAVTLGDGGDDIAINSDDWDISGPGVASGLTGLTSTGTINFSGSGEFRIREDTDPATNATCTTLDELIIDTTDNELQICTATGSPGTWASISGGGSQDFESVYSTDAGNNLVTSDAIFTITTGTNDFVVDSNDWNVTAAGALDATSLTDGTATLTSGSLNGLTGADATTENTIEATIFDADAENISGVWEVQDNVAFQFGNDADVLVQYDETTDNRLEITGPNANIFAEDAFTVAGLLTGTAGATLSGAAINLNASSNFVTNIGTGSTNAAVTIGGNSNTVEVNSSNWDISTAGEATGLTGITSTGGIDFTGASSFLMHQASSDPGTCSEGQTYYNTTSNLVRVCTATNTWADISATATPTHTITLVPEYPGATMVADGANNSGIMTSDFCSEDGLRNVNSLASPDNDNPCDNDVAGEEHNYYTWTSTTDNQDYDIWVRWQVPSNFKDFSGLTDAVQAYGWRTDGTTNAVQISMYDTAGAADATDVNVATGTAAWTLTTIDTTPSGTYTAGSYVTFKIHMVNGANDHVKVGEILIDYNIKD